MVAARAPHRRSRLRVRDWRVRTKLGVVLIIPTLALLTVGGVQVQSQVNEATQLDDFAGQVGLGRQAAVLIHELQGERDRTVGDLAAFEAVGRGSGPGKASAAVEAQRKAVDRAVAAFRGAAATVDGNDVWRSAYSRIPRRLEALPATRAGVDSGSLPRKAAHDVYGRTIETLLNLLSIPAAGPNYEDLDAQRAGYVELARMKELHSQLRARIYAVGRAAVFGAGDYSEINDLRARRQTALIQFRAGATADLVNRYDVVVRGPELLRGGQIEQQVVDSNGRSGRLGGLDAAQWWQSSSDNLNRIRGMEQSLIADASAAASDRSGAQLRRTGLVAGGLTLVVLVALIVSLLIGRSMARSLRVLRGEALQVAQTELPQVLQRLADLRAAPTDISVRPRTVGSADEIGEVAEAFTAVHASAVSLALEQAAMRRNVNTMFVNLARRSQVLVERQLELLDQLESKEGDPDVLENLFRLDHLAARMRRNDESLLVLAGNENARRWRSPIAVSAAMLAAIAEIEQYPRVRHSADDTWYIVGHAAADLVHLLAELLENATAFSPPSTLVKISGDVVGDHVLIEITDEGIGMSPEAIDSANAVLESPPAADVAASERMGLFVVSHLASRHGVRVRLRSAGRGVVASAWLPPELLAQPEPQETGAMPADGDVLTPSEVL
ncbi:MAG TPA: nitrate- and nitrite sensing domain-containing protein, partial [Micromonosporaceae bacterium]|nr:nitrate- and nitrite sensing domain-containing protein [Micromonosporaceae bacterium]